MRLGQGGEAPRPGQPAAVRDVHLAEVAGPVDEPIADGAALDHPLAGLPVTRWSG